MVDTGSKPKKEDGRKAVKKSERIDKKEARILDVRGDSVANKKTRRANDGIDRNNA